MGTHTPEQIALLTDYDGNSAYNNAYYTVYANIRFGWNSEQIKHYAIALVTPTTYPGSGVATANVAIAAAQSGTPTILVDADSLQAGLGQRFGLDLKAGLGDLLAGGPITTQALAPCLKETFIPGLYLVGMGKSLVAPHEFSRLLAKGMRDLLISLRQCLAAATSKPGLIIFNCPPMLAGIDASEISSLVDQTFLLIVSGRTTRMQVRRAQEQLQRAHAQLAGSIMLDV